jgi:hypothetical protein
MRHSQPKVPGTPTRRPIVDVDATPPCSIAAAAALRRDLLAALADGPLMKWELREKLHISETIIVRQLRRLRLEGHVKVVGKILDKRAWALTTWIRPVPVPQTTYADAAAAAVTKKPKGPKESWWATPGMTREDFIEARRRRDRELGRENAPRV